MIAMILKDFKDSVGLTHKNRGVVLVMFDFS